jgi:hypothetical protein
MELVIDGSKASAIESKLIHIEGRLISGLMHRVESIVVVGFIDVYLVGTDPNDRTLNQVIRSENKELGNHLLYHISCGTL